MALDLRWICSLFISPAFDILSASPALQAKEALLHSHTPLSGSSLSLLLLDRLCTAAASAERAPPRAADPCFHKHFLDPASAVCSSLIIMSSDADLYQIAILIDELKHSDVQCRLNSMQKLPAIAAALGPERTRSELVPYVGEGVDDDDEVLLVMAEQLGGLAGAVGGAEHVHVLLEPLEALASVEESAVRDRACAAINKLLQSMPASSVRAHAWPLIKRLGGKDWFTSRASACSLVARAYSRLAAAGSAAEEQAGREDALGLYRQMCSSEEVPVVRRAGAAELPAMATVLAGGALPAPGSSSSSSSSSSSASSSDAAGLTAALAGLSLAASSAASSSASSSSSGVISLGGEGESLVPTAPAPVQVSCASAASGAAAVGALLPLALSFARDDQDSVRLLVVPAAVALARCANGGMGSACDGSEAAGRKLASGAEARRPLLPLLRELAGDRAWRVRWSMAHRLSELCEALGPACCEAELLPMLERLLQDAEPEVRAAAAYRLCEVGRLVGTAPFCRSVLPLLSKVVEDASEHVRAALASVLAGLAVVLGQKAAVEGLLPHILRLLKDSSPQVSAHPPLTARDLRERERCCCCTCQRADALTSPPPTPPPPAITGAPEQKLSPGLCECSHWPEDDVSVPAASPGGAVQ